ncbi:DUF4177 domain-containing protein [Cohnella sp.]|uniref:DUF4177 domain-containing protein n=1 Tax=Cohnella sp. TaxID=1883426 RepID=UPI003703C4B7
MAKWEYKSLEFSIEPRKGFLGVYKLNLSKFDEEMNQIGEEGWELVNTLTTSDGRGTTTQIVVFQKVKQKVKILINRSTLTGCFIIFN